MAEAPKNQSVEDNPKIVAPRGTAPTAAQAEGPSLPHPSTGKPDPVSADDAINDARNRAASNDPDELDDDLNAPTNLGEKVGKPIACIVRKKFYSDEGRVEEPGKTYYIQLRKGQTFPSDVLEPIDPALASKYRAEFKKKTLERREREVKRNEMRDALLVNRV